MKFPDNIDPELIKELRHYRKLEAALPHDDVKMDLPEGARVKRAHGTWNVRWRKYHFFVGPLSKEEYDGMVARFSQPVTGHNAHWYSFTVTPVTFGGVRGVKQVQVVRELDSKSVAYALEVAGGFAHATIVRGSADQDHSPFETRHSAQATNVRRGTEWDESEWEQFFHTIQMIKNDNTA